ncbi:MAG: DUF454 domain-containing protein [Tissierellia bacterium]|nr:DUF454 domain-containing protein [Tissierellia bacterium]
MEGKGIDVKGKIRKVVYIILGLLSLIAGIIGIVLPIFPSMPFLILSSLCFAKGSARFNRWLSMIKPYGNRLVYIGRSKLTILKTKAAILTLAAIILLIGVCFIQNTYIRIIIICIIIYGYYRFIYNTKKNKTTKG